MERTDEQLALELVRPIGRNKVYRHEHYRDTPLKGYSLFSADIGENGSFPIILVRDGKARRPTDEEIDMFFEATFPPAG